MTTTLVLPCRLTPCSALWCVTERVRLESVELKKRTPIERLSREVIESRDTADEPSTVIPWAPACETSRPLRSRWSLESTYTPLRLVWVIVNPDITTWFWARSRTPKLRAPAVTRWPLAGLAPPIET